MFCMRANVCYVLIADTKEINMYLPAIINENYYYYSCNSDVDFLSTSSCFIVSLLISRLRGRSMESTALFSCTRIVTIVIKADLFAREYAKHRCHFVHFFFMFPPFTSFALNISIPSTR